ncbi:hypothetical protein Tco_1318056 [Tanacetum coccineum]
MYLTSSRPDIMFAVCACARFQVNPKSSHLHAVKRIFRYLKGQPKLGLWYPKDSPFDLVAYTDSDYAGASLDRKSTTGGCQFLGCRLISWQCKKQTVVANSTTEAEYIAASNCCGQVLWIQNQLLDYGYNFMQTKIHIDNESTICIVKNPVFHSKTKHIEIRHHFIRDSYEKKLIQMIKIHTDQNVADLLTKAFDDVWNGMKKAAKDEIRKGIGVNAGDLKLILLGINLLLLEKVNAVRHNLLLIAATTKVKTVNGEVQLQALVDGNKVIIIETSVRRDLKLEDAEGIECLPNAEIPTDPHHTPIITQPSSSQPQRKQKSRKSKKKNTEVPQPSGSTDNVPDENVPTTSNDPLLSGEDRLKLTELMDLCTNLQKKVLDLEKAKTAQDSEIASLKKKVKKLERRNKSRTPGLKRLRKVGSARRVESSDEASLGDQEDASKQGRKIADIDADAEVTLIDETQGRNDDNLMFDTGVLDEQEVEVEKVVSTAEVTTESATTTTVDELTLAQTLIEIKAAKPKVRGVMIQEPSEFTTTTTTTTPAASKPSQDKGKAKMIESEKPLKKKDQIMYDQEVALNLQAQLQAELEEEERLTRQKEEEANIALIESWDNTQAMMDADYQMAQQLQAEEQEQLSIEEKSKLFVQLLEARKKHFAEMRAREKRNKPPTQAQQRKLYCNYLKNMEGYTLKQLKGLKFEGSEKRAEDSTKRAGTKLEQEVAKKQKIDDAKVDDDHEEARMKELMNIVPDEEEVAVNAISLATKPPSIKLVKAKHGSTRLEEGYKRVLWGDLMTLFEPDVESPVWRTLQNEKVLIWKLLDSCGVHFLRLQSMHIFMLVEKRYPLTPATITCILNKKLQADHWNEINIVYTYDEYEDEDEYVDGDEVEDEDDHVGSMVQSTSFWKVDLDRGYFPLLSCVRLVCPGILAPQYLCGGLRWIWPLDTSFGDLLEDWGRSQQEFSDLCCFLNSVVLAKYNESWYFSFLAVVNLGVKDIVLAIEIWCLPLILSRLGGVKFIPIMINVLYVGELVGGVCLYNTILVQKGVLHSCLPLVGDRFPSFGVRSLNGTSGSLYSSFPGSRYFAFGGYLEELHVTWANLEKKRTRLRTYTNITQDNVLSSGRRHHQYNMTPSQQRPRRRKHDCVERIPSGNSLDEGLSIEERADLFLEAQDHYTRGNDGGLSIEERADLFLEAQNRVKKRASVKRP